MKYYLYFIVMERLLLLDRVALEYIAASSYRLSSMFVQSVRPLVMTVYFERTAEAIELPFGIVSRVGPSNRVY